VTYGWWKLLLIAIAGLFALSKGVYELTKLAAQRKRMRGGQKQLADNTLVTLTGTVRVAGEPLIAPLSGTPCVFHRSTVRVLPSHRGLTPDAVITRHAMIPFTLVTSEGDVVVDGDNAEVTFRPCPIIPRKIERELAFLREADIEVDPRRLGTDEIVITPGMKITVHGVARVEVVPEGETSFREAGRKVQLVAHDNHPITIALA